MPNPSPDITVTFPPLPPAAFVRPPEPPAPQPEPGGIPAAEAADLEARTVALAERVEAFNAQQAQ
jgi:hypothetical protein